MIHSDFNLNVRKKINDFKRIYRQNKINLRVQGLDLRHLDLERKHISQCTDHELLNIVKKMLSYLKSITHDNQHSLHDHRGIGLFIADMENTIAQYSLIGGKMKHRGRYASEILISVSNKISMLLNQPDPDAKSDHERLKNDTLKDLSTIKSLDQLHLVTSLKDSIDALKTINISAYNAFFEYIQSV